MVATGIADTTQLDGLNMVVGLGKTGLSIVRALTARGARAAVVDSRAEPPGLAELRADFPTLRCVLGDFSPSAFAGAARLILSPGVAPDTPPIAAARASGVPVWGDVELFARLARAPIAAITGSNGKSTVTALLGNMARLAGRRVAVGGNFGTPALDLLPSNEPAPQLYVLELSSFQLEVTESLRAEAAVLLNLSPDHLDRHHSFADYAAAKRRVYYGCRRAVVNADDAGASDCWRAAARTAMASSARPRRFTLGAPAGGDFGRIERGGRTYLARGDDAWLAADELSPSLPGRHNQANALAALAMGDALGLPRSAMLSALRGFCGLPHRCEIVAEADGVTWINDSKGTNVGATVAALNGLAGPLVLIAGGDGKAQDFTPLSASLAKKAKALVVIGRDGEALAAAAPPGLTLCRAVDMAHAVRCASGLAERGDTVLLSPACASFDMFASYEQRGLAFHLAVQELTGAPA